MSKENPTTMTFGHAINEMMNGLRMSADFLPVDSYIEIQKPDAHSMNTEPYLKMVTIEPPKNAVDDFKIIKCEPWVPGNRSLFAKWFVSHYNSEHIS